MNPLHPSIEPRLSADIKIGSVCVVNQKGMSPTLCIIAAVQASEYECYELLAPLDGVSKSDSISLEDAVFPNGLATIDLGKTIVAGELHIASQQGQCSDSVIEQLLRALVQRQVTRYSQHKFKATPFIAGQSPVAVSGKVLGAAEVEYMVDASLDAWLTTGRFNKQFEQQLAEFIGVKHVLSVNSGSSANLLALSALTSPKLGERALQAGDEVITVAAGFPTTVNPILQNGLVPVFVDITLPSYNIDV
ncbi:hypothetical protein LCGC14_2038770, partial [marine sediment metagenome]